jgi:hypothetical protein
VTPNVTSFRRSGIEGFQDLYVVQRSDPYAVQRSDTEVVLVILGDTVDVLDRVATEVGSPWMLANVVSLLAAPPEHHIGPVIASSRATA